MSPRKLMMKALASPGNLRFGDLVILIKAYGFELARTSGSHHIFEHPHVPELINVQNRKGKAKAYQVRQFLELVERHNLELGDTA